MTQATFFRHGDMWCGFVLKGHSDRVPAGESVICAAVSSAAYMAANTVTDVCGCPAAIESHDGFLSLRIAPADAPRCRIVLEGFHLHLEQLQKQYPKNIRLDCTEV